MDQIPAIMKKVVRGLRKQASIQIYKLRLRRIKARQRHSRELWIKSLPSGRRTTEANVLDFLKRLSPVVSPFELIRIGSPHDGGYLLPNDLVDIEAIFSPGVDYVSDFELYFAERGVHCFLADASVDGPALEHEYFHFDKKFIGPNDHQDHISLDTWKNSKNLNGGDLILQMDIEGSEWAVLSSIHRETLSNFRIVVVELHNLHELADADSYSRMDAALASLLKDFAPVHLHLNNTSLLSDLVALKFLLS